MGKNFKFGLRKDRKRKQRMKLYHKNRTTQTFNFENENAFENRNQDEVPTTNTETFNCNIENTMQNGGLNVSNSEGISSNNRKWNQENEIEDVIEETNKEEKFTRKTETFNNIEDVIEENSNEEESTRQTETFNTMQDDSLKAINSEEIFSNDQPDQENEIFEFYNNGEADENIVFEWIDDYETTNHFNNTAEDSMQIDMYSSNVIPSSSHHNPDAALAYNSERNSDAVQNDDLGSDSNAVADIETEIDNSNESDESDNDGDFYGSCDIAAETCIDGRRIVEMNYFLKQLADVEDHNFGECISSDRVFIKEVKNGLQSKLIFGCNRCGKQFSVLSNENEKTTETLGINSSAVLASNMIGIGYSQLEQFTSILDIPTMCADRFKSLNDDIGALWELTAEQSMKEAAEEERQAAIERGDIDEEDGIPFISVVTDGCWCKRSYHKNYNALSGVAAIVGATFGKVLWIGVRNKYCVICVRNKNKDLTPPPHFCTCNYSGPSSDMEWQSIVQGFERSVEMYNVRYLKVIADGDSSTYLKIQEAKPYQHRIVEKDECCNHLLRNFRKQLESATTGCPRGLTKHVVNSLERIRKGIACAVKHRNDENKDENEKISLLKSDISNVIHHVFGDHVNCPSYVKDKCKEEEENHIPALKQSGTYEKLSVPIRKLMYCAKDLLLGQTNNIAEHYNSIVAKFVGGKRVNFAMSNAFLYKAHAAAVQFNSKKAVTTLYRTSFQKDPPLLTQKIELKRLQKAIYGKERRTMMKENKIRPKRFNDNKEKGTGYGENCQDTDMAAEDFEKEKEIILGKLKDYQENRNANEEKTRKKDNVLFQKIIGIVLMASNFGKVCKARVMSNQVKNVCKKMISYNKAERHNNESQPVAMQQLSKQEQISIRECGVCIDKQHKCLAASPTGVTNDGEMIVEIQCPTKIAAKDPMDSSVLLKLPYMEQNNQGKLGLKKSDDLYYQIQGELHILEKNVCLFAVWTSSLHKMYVERIERDETFFNSKMKTRLITFYNDWLLPELADPRLKRSMSVREPGSSTA